MYCRLVLPSERAEISDVCRADKVKKHGEVYKEFTRNGVGRAAESGQAPAKWCLSQLVLLRQLSAGCMCCKQWMKRGCVFLIAACSYEEKT